jgi:hypothetical protein
MRWRENLRVVALNVISHETKARGARRSAVAVQRRVRKRVSSSSWGGGVHYLVGTRCFTGRIRPPLVRSQTGWTRLHNNLSCLSVLRPTTCTWITPRWLFTYQICPESVLPRSEKEMVFFVAMAKRKIPFF